MDGADLKLSAGQVGLNYSSSGFGIISNAAARIISVVGLTASCWAMVQLSQSAGVVVTEITSILGETNPAALPASWTGAYDAIKGGHYITATKRAGWLVWINAAGAVEGIVNEIGGCNGYAGYATSDDAFDIIYRFEYISSDIRNLTGVWDTYSTANNLTIPTSTRNCRVIITASGKTMTFPSAATCGAGKVIEIIINYSNTVVTNCTRAGAETFNGLTTMPIYGQYKTFRFVSDGSNWIVSSDHIPCALTTGVIDPANTNVTLSTIFNTLPGNAYIMCWVRFSSATTAGRNLRIWQDAAGTIPGVCGDPTTIPGLILNNPTNSYSNYGFVVIKTDASGNFYWQVSNADVNVLEIAGFEWHL